MDAQALAGRLLVCEEALKGAAVDREADLLDVAVSVANLLEEARLDLIEGRIVE